MKFLMEVTHCLSQYSSMGAGILDLVREAKLMYNSPAYLERALIETEY